MTNEPMLPTDDAPVVSGGDAPASVVLNLKARRQAIVDSEFLTLPVPRWTDPEIFVRYHPLDHPTIRRIQGQVDRVPAKDKAAAEVASHMDILIRACEAVYARLGDEKFSLRPDDPRGSLTKFDPDLADNLGLPEDDRSARATVRALFLTDGDIISTANQVIKFSGYRAEVADTEVEGE